MKNMIARIMVLWLILATATGNAYSQTSDNYLAGLEKWHKRRIESLKSENGWLNLAGLFWLAEGKNSFGSDKQEAIVFPTGSIAGHAGYFERSGNMVRMVVDNAPITVNGKPATDAVIYHSDSAKQPTVASGNLRWAVIKREEKIGIRLRDLASEELKSFKGIERFKPDTAWRLEAVFQKHMLPTQIPITNVLGQTSLQPSPGKLFFTINGSVYSLEALEEDDKLFIVFADETSGGETYGTGRFLTVDKPGADGNTVIDFNKAYNPPCAFTRFATCPLPPKQNVLPVAITAGEKDYGQH